MKITDIRIRSVQFSSKMKAVVSVTFDEAFVVHDMKVIEGQNGLFLAMPSRRAPSGEYKDIAHPISCEMRQHLQEAVLAKYYEFIDSQMPCEEDAQLVFETE